MSSNTVGKHTLAARLAPKWGVSAKDSERLVQAVVDEIGLALQAGEPVTLRGFGAFHLREKAARSGTFGSGEDAVDWEVGAKLVIKFSPSTTLADAVAKLDLSN